MVEGDPRVNLSGAPGVKAIVRSAPNVLSICSVASGSMFIVPVPLTLPIISSPPVDDARFPLLVVSIVPLLTSDPTTTPSPNNEWPFSTRMLPAAALPDVPTSTNEAESTLSVDPLQTASADETRTAPPVVAEMVPSPDVGPPSDPHRDRSVMATMPPLIWIEPEGSMAVSADVGGPLGSQ